MGLSTLDHEAMAPAEMSILETIMTDVYDAVPYAINICLGLLSLGYLAALLMGMFSFIHWTNSGSWSLWVEMSDSWAPVVVITGVCTFFSYFLMLRTRIDQFARLRREAPVPALMFRSAAAITVFCVIWTVVLVFVTNVARCVLSTWVGCS